METPVNHNHPSLHRPKSQKERGILEAIVARIEEEGDCWIWRGQIRRGVPVLRVDGYPRPVRRLLWQIRAGSLDIDDARFRYTATCGNPMCVSPDCTLRLSTHDMVRRAAERLNEPPIKRLRALRISISKRDRCKLSDEQVRYILEHPEKTLTALAAELGCSHATVGRYRARKSVRVDRVNPNPWLGLLAA
jgi:hypothetical protein